MFPFLCSGGGLGSSIVTPTGTGLSQYNTSGHTTNTLAITFPSDSKYIAIDVMATHFATVSAITSVTVDGQAATAVTGTDTGGLNAGVWIREWGYEIDPVAAGVTLGSSVNVVVTFAGTVTVSQNVAQAFTVGSGYSLSSEGGFNSGLVAAGGGTKTFAPTTTTVADNYLFGGYINFGSSVADVATVDTQVAENWDSNNGTITNCAMSAITGSGETLGWTDLNSFNYAGHVWVIKAT
jgi:hypothetical protein